MLVPGGGRGRACCGRSGPLPAPAMAAPILAYEDLGVIQGHGWLFRHLDIHIGARDRLALIGRNGAGKTTLLKLIGGLIDSDEGRRVIVPGTRVVLLEQEPSLAGCATLADYVLGGADAPERHEADAIADQLGIDLSRESSSASGGARRSSARWRRTATCCCSTSGPTISTSPRSTGWRIGWVGSGAPSSS